MQKLHLVAKELYTNEKIDGEDFRKIMEQDKSENTVNDIENDEKKKPKTNKMIN